MRLLQAGVVAIGVVAVALLLWEPQVEGVNANATQFEIYFTDPFLAYAYLGSTPFFACLYQAFRLLGLAGRDRLFSPDAAKALRTIRYCALAIVGFVAGGEVFIMLQSSEDRAGGVFIGGLIALGAIVVAAATTVIEGRLRKGAPSV